MFTVSVNEVKTIVRAIKKANGTDLSGLAIASLRYRLSGILKSYKLENTESLIAKFQNDPDFLDRFISDISVGSPDMFRDPDLWIHIRENLLPIIFATPRLLFHIV